MLRYDLLTTSLQQDLANDARLLRRVTRYLLPLLLLPVGIALAQVPFSVVGAVGGGVTAVVLLIQAGLLLQPLRRRLRVNDQDLQRYLGVALPADPPVPLFRALLPAIGALLLGGLGAALAARHTWQAWQPPLLLALLLGAIALLRGELLLVLREATRLNARLARLTASQSPGGIPGAGRPQGAAPAPYGRPPVAAPAAPLRNPPPIRPREIARARPADDPAPAHPSDPSPYERSVLRPSASSSAPPGQTISAPNASPLHGLLDPDLARRVRGLPRPGQRLSPAALALLRTEAYILLRADPQRPDDDLLALTADLAETAAGQERQHAHLPAVGGKLYLPVNAGGVLAARLRDTVRALELDGAYSATLGTWLIRLPPARSYAVAGRLIDALIALEILPNGAILPHHLTVSGDLGERAKLLSLIHLAALPLILSERPGTGGDQRPFIMRGGGVLDDLDGRGRASGPRTDFVDGFLFVNTPGFTTVEQLTAHTVNLRTKQLLAHGLRCTTLSAPTRLETQAANHFWSFENGLRELLAAHDLAGALDVLWLDTGWNTIWPYIARLSQIKQQDPAFIPAARSLRDAALEALERT